MLERIDIQTSQKNYPVVIGEGAIKTLENYLSGYSSVMVITDETVAGLYLAQLRKQAGIENLHEKIVPSGEKAKTFDIYYGCLSEALKNKLDRKSLIISFGGGAVGDLAGFVAATYMRGIDFIQVPTTILAHDSAVGGKVAINHPLGKNMVGAFHQPEAVIYDLDFLRSLPEKEIRSGFAEVVKHALISDDGFYHKLMQETSSVTQLDLGKASEFLAAGIKVKGRIVAEDEKETGIRAYLNFGHTLGHAIEAEMGYGNMTHGEAVMIGMVFALRLSRRMKGLEFAHAEFEAWVQQLGYRIYLPESLDIIRLVERMKQDKKSVLDSIRFVLLEKTGVPVLAEVEEQELTESLNEFKKEGELLDKRDTRCDHR